MRELRVPRTDGALLLEPEASLWQARLDENRRRLGGWTFAVAGRPFAEVRAEVRRRTLEAAGAYRRLLAEAAGTDRIPPAPRAEADAPLVVTGHQAELYHVGVWVKNFLAARLAGAAGGSALNLTVDTDAPRSAFLEIPEVGDDGALVKSSVRFAEFTPDTAVREQPALSRELLKQAAGAACRAIHNPPQCRNFGGFFRTALDTCDRLNPADCLAAARIACEAEWNLANHEVAVSRLNLAPLIDELAGNAERFRAVHNAALEAYRKRNRIRGAGRPVPPLGKAGDRIELPFWGWRAGGRRRRVFASPAGLCLEDQPVDRADPQITIAPRALALTLFARMFLADVFIHGIGGAKYDELTDDLIRDYFGVEPPHLLIASATLFLPLPQRPATEAQRLELLHRQRDFRFNPQRYVASEAADLLQQRRAAIAESDRLRAAPDRHELHAERHRAFVRIRELDAALAASRPELPARWDAELAQCDADLRHNRIARDREWFFALHPPDRLGELWSRLPEFPSSRGS